MAGKGMPMAYADDAAGTVLELSDTDRTGLGMLGEGVVVRALPARPMMWVMCSTRQARVLSRQWIGPT